MQLVAIFCLWTWNSLMPHWSDVISHLESDAPTPSLRGTSVPPQALPTEKSLSEILTTSEGNCHLVVKFPQNIPAFITAVGLISTNSQLHAFLSVKESLVALKCSSPSIADIQCIRKVAQPEPGLEPERQSLERPENICAATQVSSLQRHIQEDSRL